MIKLYGYWRSSASYRVRLALAIKAIKVEHIAVNLLKGEQKKEPHIDRNALGTVPVLETEDGQYITQSLAIITYLENRFPSPNLLGQTPQIRADILSAALTVGADISPLQNLSVLNYLKQEFGHSAAQTESWAQHWISRGFHSLENKVAQRKFDYFFGDAPSLFEIFLVPQMYNARRFGVDLHLFPALTALDNKCRLLSSFKEAAPEAQPDAPEK